jgi:hypothetical protein
MPAPLAVAAWGRAVGREILDPALLDAARRAGVHVIQPPRSMPCAATVRDSS